MTITDSDADRAHAWAGQPWPVTGTVVSHLLRQARTRGDAPFLTTVSPDGQHRTLTYLDAEEHSRRLAGWLRREGYAVPGRPLALVPLNEASSVLAVLAALRSGCPLLLLSPADPAARLLEQVTALGAGTVLYARDVAGPRLAGAIELPEMDDLDAASDVDVPLDPAADALYFGTSGSTAASKLVAQSHHNAVSNAVAVGRHHRLVPGDRLLGCLPIHHVNGMHFTVLGTLVAGAHLMLAHAFDPFGYPRLIELFRPRIASVVPSVLEALLPVWRDRVIPAAFEYFVSAAAPLSAVTARQVWERMGVRVMQGYGLTETTNFSTTMPPDLSAAAYRRLMLDADVPSIGVAVPGNEVAVLRPDGSRAEHGEAGELCMRGHNVMTGYAGNPEATREAFRHGWFHSQDLGRALVDEESGRTFFVITGRAKNIAKIAGEAVSLEEMERVLLSVPGVSDAGCIGVPHRFTGEEIVAGVVLNGPDRPDFRLHLLESFAAAMVPRRFVVLPEIPRTTTGKILRPRLRELILT
jgi:acyl-CoA synthetase (AMP-forming)/AMP-acid ligase II